MFILESSSTLFNVVQRLFKSCSILILAGLTACASVFNPYESEFTCPQSEAGTCAPVKQVYEETKAGVTYPAEDTDCIDGTKDRECSGCSRGEGTSTVTCTSGKSESVYTKAKNQKLSSLLQSPQTPMAIPPKVLRIAILPYIGRDNELYMPRYIYIFADQPEWVISNIKAIEE
jgi:conjugal transfer pilus assembly protein TraV